MLFTKRVAKKLLDLIFSYTETTMESLNLSASDDVSRAYFYGWYYFSLLSFGVNEKVINHVFTLMVDYIRSLSSQDSISHLRSQTLEYTLRKTVTHFFDIWPTPPKSADDFLVKFIPEACAHVQSRLKFTARTDYEEVLSVLIEHLNSFVQEIKAYR